MNSELNKAVIDLSALKSNLETVRKMVGRDTAIMGIVKSDAYGHGLVEVAGELERLNIHSLGVADIDEALRLRSKGIKKPIAVLLGVGNPKEAESVVEYGLTPVVYDLDAAQMLSAEGKKHGIHVNTYLKVDTGMRRLGIDFREAYPFLKRISRMKGVKVQGLFSHLSMADQEKDFFTEIQVREFKGAISAGRSLGLDLKTNNLANSAGIMKHKDTHFDLVRPGIMLYGGLPCPDFENPPPLSQMMTFESRVLQVRDVDPGTPVGYGGAFYTDRPTKIAVISAGYGNGIFRSLGNRGVVLIHGRRAKIVGRICMNLTMADVTLIKGVKKGDRVCFLGKTKGDSITADQMADWTYTVSYEVFCSIGSRNKRKYVYEKESGPNP